MRWIVVRSAWRTSCFCEDATAKSGSAVDEYDKVAVSFYRRGVNGACYVGGESYAYFLVVCGRLVWFGSSFSVFAT